MPLSKRNGLLPVFYVEKRVTEKVRVGIEWADVLLSKWEGEHVYNTGDFVRPRIANGFEYEATDGGQSPRSEPRWPKVIGETVIDGSIVWTCRDYGSSASDSIATAGTDSDAGITVGATVAAGTRRQFLIEGGAADSTYSVRPYITLGSSGERLEAVVLVSVVD